jgi:hypothetical protein
VLARDDFYDFHLTRFVLFAAEVKEKFSLKEKALKTQINLALRAAEKKGARECARLIRSRKRVEACYRVIKTTVKPTFFPLSKFLPSPPSSAPFYRLGKIWFINFFRSRSPPWFLVLAVIKKISKNKAKLNQ